MNGLEKEIIEVALDDIIPNRFQPRLSFDEAALNDLAKSIRQHGIIQPLVLREVGNKYEIIAGERRYKASYIAGLTKVPAVILNINDNESAEVAIVENLQREDLSAIEEAKSYKKLLDRGYLTQEQLATRMGKTQATISNKLRLLNLTQEVQDALLNNQISERHARSLLRLINPTDQINMLHEIISKRLNVRSTEEEINKILNKESSDDEGNKEELVNNNFNIPNINITNEDIFQSLMQNDENIKEEEPELKPVSSNPIPFIRPVLDDKPEEFNNISVEKEEEVPVYNVNTGNIKMADDKIRELISTLSDLGFKVKLEEFDFDSLYQYVIKIDK